MRSTNELSVSVVRSAGTAERSILCALFVAAVIALGTTVFGPVCTAAEDGDALPFKKTQMRIELNSTGGDAGLQFDLDADQWRMLEIENPKGRVIFSVKSLGKLKTLGNTELFTESNEPPFDELPLPEFLKMFPAGNYEFDAITIDGEELEGVAAFTHTIPCAPVILSPSDGDTLDPDEEVVIVWEPVTNKIDTGSNMGDCSNSTDIEIISYQVVVDHEGVVPQKRLDVKVPADVTQLTIPAEFIVPDGEYKVEVLAIEAGGNQTITESIFMTSSN